MKHGSPVELHHTSTWLTHAITIFLGFRATPISSNPAACIASPSSSLYQSAAGWRFCRLLRSVNYHMLVTCQEHSKKIPFTFRFQKEKNPFTYEFACML